MKLGYGGTQSEMARLINDSGVLGDTFKATAENLKDIPFSKQIEAIHEMQVRMGITGTTTKEAMSTISGSIGLVKSAWGNMLTYIGSGDLGSALGGAEDLFFALGTAAANVVPKIAEMGALIVKHLPEVIAQAGPKLREGFVAAIGQMVDVGAIESSVGESLIESFDGIVARASSIWGRLSGALSDAMARMQEAARPALEALGPLFEDAFNAVTTVIIPGIAQLTESVLPPFGEALQALADSGALTSISTALMTFAQTALPPIVDFLSLIATTLLPPLAEALANVSPVLGGMVGPLLLIGGAMSLWNGFLGPVVQGVTGFASAIGGIAGAAGSAAPALGGLGSSAGGVGAAAGPAAGQIAAIGAAALGIGLGIGAACLGISQLVQSAIQLGNAGPQAQAAMLGLGVGIAAFAGVLALLGPALTASAVGIGVFGAAVLAIGAGVLAAGQGINLMGQGISRLASAMPAFNANALEFAGSLAAIAIPLAAVAVPAGAAGVAFVALSAGLAATAAGLVLVGAGAMTATMGLTLLSTGAVKAQATLPALGPAVDAAASGLGRLAPAATVAGSAAQRVAQSGAQMSAAMAAATVTNVAASAAVTKMSSTLNQNASAYQKVTPAARQMQSGVQNACNAATRSVDQLAGRVQSALARVKASFSGLQFHIPSPTLGPMPHFSMSGKFDLQAGTVPSINVSWYRKGGVFDRPSIIGVGDVPGRSEIVTPEDKMYEVTYAANRASTAPVVEAIDRAVDALPAIIAEYTPVMGQRDFRRKVRSNV